MSMEHPDVAPLLPHAGRMVWLDRIVGHGDGWLEAEVTVRRDALLADETGVGSWIGIEYMAQTIGAYAGLRARARGEPVKIGFLVGTRGYASRWPRFPLGSRLRIHVRLDCEAGNGMSVFACRIVHDGEELAAADLNVFQPADPIRFLEENAP
jgi:predicted hotdog family 3-hydroxylacyl-ACP dehydratase